MCNRTENNAEFLFGMCDCTVSSDVGTGDFSLVMEFCTCVDI